MKSSSTSINEVAPYQTVPIYPDLYYNPILAKLFLYRKSGGRAISCHISNYRAGDCRTGDQLSLTGNFVRSIFAGELSLDQSLYYV